ncbi:MAG: TIGR03086 family protein [Sciscionella sp.]|nr:TIGR03086 family protein [Sciscionella sp.]
MRINLADPSTATTLRAFDAEAVRTSVDLVALATESDLARPTPCVDWTLHGLIAHMATQHYGFAAASTGADDPGLWKRYPIDDDPIAAYRGCAEHVIGVFAADGVLDREFPLPEFGAGAVFPGRYAISFHFIDYVVHSWDVARTLGVEVAFGAELLDAALAVAKAVPTGDTRLAPGAAFAPALTFSGTDRLGEVVAMLGRAPDWHPKERT